MRPPGRVLALALIGSVVVFGIVAIGVVESDTTERGAANSDGNDSVVVQNESTYEISQTLQFDVDGTDDTYVIRTETGSYVDQISAKNGTVTLETGFMNAGTYVLVNKTTEAVEYQFTLTSTETSTTVESSEETQQAATVAENGSTHEISTRLAFEVSHEGDTYELREGDERLYVDQLQATDGSVVLNTKSLDPGNYVLVHERSDDVEYHFTLVRAETTVATSTTTPNSTTSESPITTTTERTPTTSEILTTTTTERTPTTSETPTATSERTATTTTRTTFDGTSETPTETEKTVARTEGYYPSVPGFSFTSAMLALVSGGLLLYRRCS